MSSPWLRRLVRVGLEQQSLRGLSAVAEVVTQATGTTGAVLWEAAQKNGSVVPSVFAAWLRGGAFGHVGFTPAPDTTTLAAFTERTLAIPQQPFARLRTSGSSGSQVMAALPVDWLDGNPGALTLLGDEDLSASSFDILADLIEVLPHICLTIRERQTLALVNACTSILREADLESPEEPLERERLSYFLSEVCRTVADGLQCFAVSLYLQEPTQPTDEFPLFASSDFKADGDGVRRGVGWVGSSIEQGVSTAVPILVSGEQASPSNAVDRTLMVAPLVSGQRTWGAIRCTGTYGPPFHFTDTDLSLLTPIAAQIAQYWSHWLHRREILGENSSWRSLASGITVLNRQVHDQLSRKRPQDEPVYQAAFRVIEEVVGGCAGTDVRIPVEPQEGVARELDVASTHGPSGALDAGRAVADSVYRTGRQRLLGGAAGTPGPFPVEAGDRGWLVSTPINVSGTTVGVLTTVGEHGTPPSSSPQVCEIIGDQLGLYHYLRQTLQRLRETKQKLEHTVRSQAAALEDLEHQLVSPLLGATVRTERVLARGRFDGRTEAQLRAVRGLCRRASRVALSAGVFSLLSKGHLPCARTELLGAEDLLRLVILSADDAQLLINPRREIRIDVERASLRGLGRRLVSADHSFLEQCVSNLLDNAAKYSYESTTVEVSGETTSEGFLIRVSSTGIPLRPEDVERCLERNWRGPSARSTTGEGSGLGLWIVDNLMRSMKGSLAVAVADDSTTVSLSLPYA
jgi:signal transduction histidine kinase